VRARARIALALAGAAAVMAVLASSASAHAILQQTSPPSGETVKRQPKVIEFRFNEAVETNFGAVKVFDAKGHEVESGGILRPDGQSSVATALKPNLAKGSYTATYHVISADSHPVSGGFVFSVGRAGATPKTVAQLTAADKVGESTQIGFGIARGIGYAAIAIVAGSLFFLIWTWLPALRSTAGADASWREASERFSQRLRSIVLLALFLGGLSEALQLVFQGATATGSSFWQAVDSTILREVIHTRFGTVHLLALLAFTAMLLLSVPRGWAPVLRPASVGATGLAAPRLGRAELAVIFVLAGFLVISPSLAGHASTQSPKGVLVPADIVHVAAMSVWLGGLVALIAVLPVATRALETSDRTRLLAAVLLRFSPVALTMVSLLLVSGLVQGYIHVRSLDNLIHTGYGRAVLAKMILLAILIGFGSYNRRLLPRLKMAAAGGASPGAAGAAIRSSLRAEVALIAVVLAVTSALVSYAPATSRATGPFAATKTMGPLELQVTIDPARTGQNAMHLYITNAKDGRQFTGTKQLDVLLSLPSKGVGPLRADARKAGPGHYVVLGADFVPGGKWKVQIADRVSAFDQYQTTMDVPIR